MTHDRDTTVPTMVMLNLTPDERRAYAQAANAAMDRARAAKVEPNGWLRTQFDQELVLGVWQDPTEPAGVAIAALKGHGRLLLLSQGSRSLKSDTATIRCRSAEEAEALCRVFGDGRARASA